MRHHATTQPRFTFAATVSLSNKSSRAPAAEQAAGPTARLHVVSKSTCTASCSFVPYSWRSWAQASHWLKALRRVISLKKDRATRAALFSSTDSCHCLQHCGMHAQMQHIQATLLEASMNVRQLANKESKSVGK